MRKQVCEKMGQ